jgi:hypothetical protein
MPWNGCADGRIPLYCLNDQDHIIVGDDLDVLDLEVAIQAAYRACREHPHCSASRIEVWQGASRLYSSTATQANTQG